MYHVVDGKQRLETILGFADNKLRISKEFGDARLDGKKWKQLEGETELKHRFWNYQISVEMVDVIDGTIVNAVFDRLNRNSRKLMNQELRHAKYDGWFITVAEAEADKEEWKKLGIVTTARAKRMADVQFISELLIVLIKQQISGFDQDEIDEFYANYDDPEDTVPDFSKEDFTARLERTKEYLLEMDKAGEVISRFARTLTHFYTLWSVVALNLGTLQDAATVAAKYEAFMEKVEAVASAQKDGTALPNASDNEARYLEMSRGANTELPPRRERYALLSSALA